MRVSAMGRTGYAILTLSVWAVLAALLLAPGHLAVSGIEGDVLHALDGAMRMAMGGLPHLDFATPLGILAFGIPALPLGAGLGPGLSLIASNLAVALLAIPALLWLRATRLSGWPALLLGLWVLIECAGLVHDATTPTVTMALYYNRWGWAVFAMLALLLLIDPSERREAGDGLMLGLGAAFLVLVKVTFFAALLLPATIWILSGRRWRTLGWAGASGLAVAAAVTLWTGGPGFWLAYLSDLLMVAGSETRPSPGLSLAEIMAAPQHVMASFALLGGIVALRLAGLKARGLILLTLLPGMIYVTFQNWANAPVWLVPLALVLLDSAMRVEGRRVMGLDARVALGGLALIAGTQVTPYVANMAASPFRHLAIDREEFSAAMAVPGWDDVLFETRRGALATAQVPMGTPPDDIEEPGAKWELTPFVFQGRSFPACVWKTGLAAQMEARARSLSALPQLDGASVMTVDLMNVTWMFTGGQPLTGGSPWYYGGAKGFSEAGWFVVPLCPQSTLVRALMLEELSATGWTLRVAHADDTLVVYERIR